MLPKVLHQWVGKMPGVRRFHCFCLGAAKTGTTSVGSMFADCYRSAHEPDSVALTGAVATLLAKRPLSEEGGTGRPENAGNLDVPAWLQARDQRLNLELEASHPLGYMAPWLPEVFPEAGFIITIRDPLAWLKSRLNFHYYKSPPEWQSYRDLIWSRWHRGYQPEEALLKEMGLYSLDAYLAQYSEQYRLLMQYLPSHRRLLVNTDALDASAERMAGFLGIDPDTITRQHVNAFAHEKNVIDQLPADFVAARIAANCRWMKAIL